MGIMSSLLTFVVASLLAGADLWLLAQATRRLGNGAGRRETLLLALGVALKMAVLVGGVFLISRQPWYDRRALLVGLVAPFTLFIAWQGLRLQLSHGRRP
jgi:hypothetical protein